MRLFRLSFLLLCVPLVAGDTEMDQFHKNRFQGKTKLAWPISDDYTFLRRAYLDITGSLPNYATRARWFDTEHPWDRDAIVEEALASEEFNYRWTYFLEELLGIHKLNTDYLLVRDSFHATLRDMVATDMGWDQIAGELINWEGRVLDGDSLYNFWGVATGEPLTWLDALDDQTGYITEKFLGIKATCISCHDGAYHLEEVNVDLSKRTRQDFWAMAAFLAGSAPSCETGCEYEGVWQLHEFGYYNFDDTSAGHNRNHARVFGSGEFGNGFYHAQSETGEGMRPARSGGYVSPKYLFTGEEVPRNEPRRSALARMLVNDRQFARNMVNRMWKHFFGKGFVEPVDSFDLARLNGDIAAANGTTVQPGDPEMMEYLTDLYITDEYKFKPFIRTIVLSSLYQLDLEALDDGVDEAAYFGGKQRFRRLEAEAILESVYTVVGDNNRFLYTLTQSEPYEAYTAWDLPDSSEPLYNPGVADILNNLGRGDRFNDISAREELDQTACLTLLNNPSILSFLDYGPNFESLIIEQDANNYDDAWLVNQLYLHTLLRPANQEEIDQGVAALTKNGVFDGTRDIVWRLVNHMDFLFK